MPSRTNHMPSVIFISPPLLRHLPMVADLPFPVQARHATLRQIIGMMDTVRDDPALREELFAALAAVPHSRLPG
jgi:hypothetical protein